VFPPNPQKLRHNVQGIMAGKGEGKGANCPPQIFGCQTIFLLVKNCHPKMQKLKLKKPTLEKLKSKIRNVSIDNLLYQKFATLFKKIR